MPLTLAELQDEQQRVEALQALEILDTPEEQEYDELVELASEICGAPISLISLVDSERQWFKASVGVTAKETHRNVSFCSHAIQQPDMFIVEDAAADERFRDNALVTGEVGIRFYAGVPLHAPSGHAIGSLCVIDRIPRTLSDSQKHALTILARQVKARMELRYKQRMLEHAVKANEELLATLRERNELLSGANAQLELLATTDPLTGLFNRRVFEQRIGIEFATAVRKDRPLSLLLLDIDNFKRRNDTYGHAAGDDALRLLGTILCGAIRIGDLAARIGGEEFAVMLPETDALSATVLATRLQSLLRQADTGPTPLTVSMGIAEASASHPGTTESWKRLLASADAAMYDAKKAGKDRYVIHEAFGLSIHDLIGS